MITSYPHLETERDGPVMIIRLANEKARNTLTRELRFSLRDAVRAIEDDRSIRAVYLTGKGPSFCAGGDFNMLVNASDPWPVHRRFRHASTVFPPLLTLDRPVVCGVRGHAVGGGMGIALMADVMVAGESAKFMTGFFRLGVVPDCLSLFLLPRLIGLARTRTLLMTNGTLTADAALTLGLVANVVPDDQVDAEGLALAHNLAAGPAEVIGVAKQLLLKSFESSLDDIMMYEDLGQSLAMSSAEFREGLEALREKRKPDYLGASQRGEFNDGLPASMTKDAAGSV